MSGFTPLAFHLRSALRQPICRISLLLLVGMLTFPTVLRAQEGVHIVQRGESLGLIAQQYGVSLDTLMAINGISDPHFVYSGQRLFVTGDAAPQPPATVEGIYYVQPGDTLSEIAQRFRVSTVELMRLNGLQHASFVWVGQPLQVPGGELSLAAPAAAEESSLHIVRRGESLSVIAAAYGVSVQELMAANGIANPSLLYVGQQLHIGAAPEPAPAADVSLDLPSDGRRWIEIDLGAQTLTAWQDNVRWMHTSISSGKLATPTVTGRYRIGAKYAAQDMSGPDYSLADVPWVMYFYSGYAIHGAYWHNAFGTPTSHGCINMQVDEAARLYAWAEPGTEVFVY